MYAREPKLGQLPERLELGDLLKREERIGLGISPQVVRSATQDHQMGKKAHQCQGIPVKENIKHAGKEAAEGLTKGGQQEGRKVGETCAGSPLNKD